jgi:sulfite oxidase
VQGWAIAGGGKKIVRIEISTNSGESWIIATITEGNQPWAWTFWEAPLKLGNGEHEIIARAFDSEGNTQPESPGEVWNFKGYMNNSWHRVKIIVKSER